MFSADDCPAMFECCEDQSCECGETCPVATCCSDDSCVGGEVCPDAYPASGFLVYDVTAAWCTGLADALTTNACCENLSCDDNSACPLSCCEDFSCSDGDDVNCPDIFNPDCCMDDSCGCGETCMTVGDGFVQAGWTNVWC